MFWICFSLEEVTALLNLLQGERECDYDVEEHGEYWQYVAYQKHMQDIYEKLLFAVEHDK